MVSNLFTIACLFGLSFSIPTPPDTFSYISSRQVSVASALLQMAPTSGSCSGATYASECATNTEAAPFLIDAMQRYGLYNMHEIVAILSVMVYESGEFKYNINHYPGTPGQGTRNMQMADFNLVYARNYTELIPQVNAITTATTTSGLSTDQVNAIRALVLPDQYSFGSGAWFYTTHCQGQASQVQTGTQAGYEAYLTSCVGATDSSELTARLAYWNSAKTAFGLS